jgi:hypothetical protein
MVFQIAVTALSVFHGIVCVSEQAIIQGIYEITIIP